jgi:hypothetical protein
MIFQRAETCPHLFRNFTVAKFSHLIMREVNVPFFIFFQKGARCYELINISQNRYNNCR